MEKIKSKRIMFRLIAAIPPLIASCFVKDLGVITDLAGTTGFAITFIFPALLHYYSRKAAVEAGLSPNTAYSTFITRGNGPTMVGVFGFLVIVFVFVAVGVWGAP